MNYTVYQGDSLWIDIKHTPSIKIDPVWANWSGKWEVSAAVGSAPLLTGDLMAAVKPGTFNLRIGPVTTAGWTDLPSGSYSLSIEINNTSADYKKETQHTLVIKTQGVI